MQTWYWLTRPVQERRSAQSADGNQIQSSAHWRNDPQKLSPKENLAFICHGEVLASSSHTTGICKMPQNIMEVCLTCRLWGLPFYVFFFFFLLYLYMTFTLKLNAFVLALAPCYIKVMTKYLLSATSKSCTWFCWTCFWLHVSLL